MPNAKVTMLWDTQEMVNKMEASGPVVPKGREVFTAGIQLASAVSVDVLYVAQAVKTKSSGESDFVGKS